MKAESKNRAPIDAEPCIDLWPMLTSIPGVGVSITTTNGELLFCNPVALEMFSGQTAIDYHGKTIGDFHTPEFTQERLGLISQVIESKRPLRIRHIYHGRPIESKLWPFHDRLPPHDRVLVISRRPDPTCDIDDPDVPIVESQFIDLGELSVLSQRELEVLILLGHGMSVPEIAKMLFRSPKTVERHKTAISEKLHIHGQAAMVSLVSKIGLELSHAKLSRLPEPNPAT